MSEIRKNESRVSKNFSWIQIPSTYDVGYFILLQESLSNTELRLYHKSKSGTSYLVANFSVIYTELQSMCQ